MCLFRLSHDDTLLGPDGGGCGRGACPTTLLNRSPSVASAFPLQNDSRPAARWPLTWLRHCRPRTADANSTCDMLWPGRTVSRTPEVGQRRRRRTPKRGGLTRNTRPPCSSRQSPAPDRVRQRKSPRVGRAVATRAVVSRRRGPAGRSGLGHRGGPVKPLSPPSRGGCVLPCAGSPQGRSGGRRRPVPLSAAPGVPAEPGGSAAGRFRVTSPSVRHGGFLLGRSGVCHADDGPCRAQEKAGGRQPPFPVRLFLGAPALAE
jgi:hypothetical protein